jgi:hypothetical protein
MCVLSTSRHQWPPQEVERNSIYVARPQSKFPWGRVQKQNTTAWKYLLQQILQVFSLFSTYSPPELRHLSYRGTNFCILCHRRDWNHCVLVSVASAPTGRTISLTTGAQCQFRATRSGKWLLSSVIVKLSSVHSETLSLTALHGQRELG